MKTSAICLAVAVGLTPGLFPSHNNEHINTKEVTMSNNERNQKAVRLLFEEVFNKGRMELLKELVTEDYTGSRGEKGIGPLKDLINSLRSAFPDIHYELEDLFGADDKVTVRWTWKGTHTGTFRTYPASGKSITNAGMAIYECRDGKITGVHMQTDQLGFLQQLGVVPANPGAANSDEAPRFIDKFFIPAAAIGEFHERTKINRDFLRTLPGFINDVVYEHPDENGNLICITVAEWASMEAVNNAKAAVQAEYKREGFNPAEMLQRLNITMDRGIYKKLKD
jgi:steroid delta-isomerase-like uncharacterized protein